MIRRYSQMHGADKSSQHSSSICPCWLNGWVFVYELSGSAFESSCSHLNFIYRACFEQGVPWHSGNHRVWILPEMRTWYNKNIHSNAMHSTDQYSQLSSITWLAWLNGWVFVYELSGSGFESNWSYLNFRYLASFKQEVPWHSGNYRVWLDMETRTWHEKKIESNAPYR